MWKAVKSPSSQPIPGAEEPEKSAGVLYRHSAARTPAYGQAASPRAESLPALALFTLSRVLESVHGSPLARSPRPPLTRTPRSLRPHRTHARQTQRKSPPDVRLSGRSASQDGRVLQGPARVHRTRPRRIAHLAHRNSRSVYTARARYTTRGASHTPPCLSCSPPALGRSTRPCWWGQCTSTQGQPLRKRAHGSSERREHAGCLHRRHSPKQSRPATGLAR